MLSDEQRIALAIEHLGETAAENCGFGAVTNYARTIERAATIAAMRRCAEICDVQHDKARTSPGAARAFACAERIRAEIARLEAEK